MAHLFEAIAFLFMHWLQAVTVCNINDSSKAAEKRSKTFFAFNESLRQISLSRANLCGLTNNFINVERFNADSHFIYCQDIIVREVIIWNHIKVTISAMITQIAEKWVL